MGSFLWWLLLSHSIIALACRPATQQQLVVHRQPSTFGAAVALQAAATAAAAGKRAKLTQPRSTIRYGGCPPSQHGTAHAPLLCGCVCGSLSGCLCKSVYPPFVHPVCMPIVPVLFLCPCFVHVVGCFVAFYVHTGTATCCQCSTCMQLPGGFSTILQLVHLPTVNSLCVPALTFCVCVVRVCRAACTCVCYRQESVCASQAVSLRAVVTSPGAPDLCELLCYNDTNENRCPMFQLQCHLS